MPLVGTRAIDIVASPIKIDSEIVWAELEMPYQAHPHIFWKTKSKVPYNIFLVCVLYGAYVQEFIFIIIYGNQIR